MLTGFLASLLYIQLKRLIPSWVAFAAGVLFVALPVVRLSTSMVMSEMLLTLGSFAAVLAFAEFMESGSARHAVQFGLFATLAIMTKGTGWILVLVPPIAVAVTARWDLLRNFNFWLPAVFIGPLCITWQVVTLRMASNGMLPMSVSYAMDAFPHLWLSLLTNSGILLGVFALLAAGNVSLYRRGGGHLRASMFAVVSTTVVFQTIVAVGAEPRRIVIAIPALFVLAALFCQSLSRWGKHLPAIAFCLGIITAAWICFPFTPKPHIGMKEAAQRIYQALPDGAAVLVAGPVAEGALVSEFAFLEPDPKRYVVRGLQGDGLLRLGRHRLSLPGLHDGGLPDHARVDPRCLGASR